MNLFKLICLLTTTFLAIQADGQWNQYEALWKGQPGRMMVNMDFKEDPSILKLNFLLEITQSGIACDDMGFPKNEELNLFEMTMNLIDTSIRKEMAGINVGRFIYKCQVKDYFYVEDTAGLNKRLTVIQNSESAMTNFTYKLIEDADHKVYNDFIYPDDYLLQTMVNGKIIKVLQGENFDFEEKANLKHTAAFASMDDRTKFRRFIQEQNFKVLELDKNEAAPLPYIIEFSRDDKLQLEQLSNITLRLFQKSNFLNGRYDGWEIELEEEQ